MNAPQLERVSGLIDLFYGSVSDPSQWQMAMEEVRVLFNASNACLARSGPDLQPHDAISTNPDPGFQRRYIEEHAPYGNIYAEALDAAPVGLIYSDHALIGEDTLRRSRFWNEWLAPQDMYGGLGSKLLATGPSFWIFDIQRGRNQTAFDAADIALLQLITPHLRRAMELGQAFQSTRALTASYAKLPYGVVVVDSQLRVMHLNAAAESIMMRPRSTLRWKSGMLATMDPGSTAKLQQLVGEACARGAEAMSCSGGDLVLRAEGEGGGLDLALSVMPATGHASEQFPQVRQAVIYLRPLTLDLPDGFEDQLRRLFDFTPAEARLAAALASGTALKEAAMLQGIRFSTARSYLENIFRKTRTRQQSQLVALLKSAPPLS